MSCLDRAIAHLMGGDTRVWSSGGTITSRRKSVYLEKPDSGATLSSVNLSRSHVIDSLDCAVKRASRRLS